MKRGVIMIIIAVVVAACGVSTQERPDPMSPPAVPPVPTPTVTKRSATPPSVTSTSPAVVQTSQGTRQVNPSRPPGESG